MSNPASPGPVPAATRRAFLGRAMAAGLGAAGIAAAADAAELRAGLSARAGATPAEWAATFLRP